MPQAKTKILPFPDLVKEFRKDGIERGKLTQTKLGKLANRKI